MQWVKASEFKYEVKKHYHVKYSGENIGGYFTKNMFWPLSGDFSAILPANYHEIMVLDESAPSFTLEQAKSIYAAGWSHGVKLGDLEHAAREYFKTVFNIDI